MCNENDKVVQLRVVSKKSEPTAEATDEANLKSDHETVQFLERLLAEARRGLITGVAGVFMRSENGASHTRIYSASMLGRGYEMTGALRALELEMLNRLGGRG